MTGFEDHLLSSEHFRLLGFEVLPESNPLLSFTASDSHCLRSPLWKVEHSVKIVQLLRSVREVLCHFLY